LGRGEGGGNRFALRLVTVACSLFFNYMQKGTQRPTRFDGRLFPKHPNTFFSIRKLENLHLGLFEYLFVEANLFFIGLFFLETVNNNQA
jgi:hypothetical protein